MTQLLSNVVFVTQRNDIQLELTYHYTTHLQKNKENSRNLYRAYKLKKYSNFGS